VTYGRDMKKLRARLMKENPTCHYCGIGLIEWGGEGCPPYSRSKHGKGYATIDHKTPRSHNGGDKNKNVVLCCSVCNREKGSKSYSEFVAIKEPMPAKS
jgi:5-methylcytosine-specific restriction endonuclease McrA